MSSAYLDTLVASGHTTLIYTGGATPPDYADDLTRLLDR